MTRRKRKLTLDQAARKLAAIVEDHLATLPVEERKARVATFHRAVAKLRESRAKPARPVRSGESRVPARAEASSR